MANVQERKGKDKPKRIAIGDTTRILLKVTEEKKGKDRKRRGEVGNWGRCGQHKVKGENEEENQTRVWGNG